MKIAIDPAATKILNTLNKSATVRGIQEDCATLKVLSTKKYRQAMILAEIVKQVATNKYNETKLDTLITKEAN